MVKVKHLSEEELYEIKKKSCLKIFKKFKRFLKETGQYHNVMSYLFTGERSFSDFIEVWVKDGGRTDILNRVDTLGPSYHNYGYDCWLRRISLSAQNWNDRCYSNSFDYV